MRFLRCKCGKSTSHTSMGPWPCDRCPYCGSDLAGGPQNHQEPKSHLLLKVPVETEEGQKFILQCQWCSQTRKEIESLNEPYEVRE